MKFRTWITRSAGASLCALLAFGPAIGQPPAANQVSRANPAPADPGHGAPTPAQFAHPITANVMVTDERLLDADMAKMGRPLNGDVVAIFALPETPAPKKSK